MGNGAARYATIAFDNSFRLFRTSGLYLQPLCCSGVCVVKAGRRGMRAKATSCRYRLKATKARDSSDAERVNQKKRNVLRNGKGDNLQSLSAIRTQVVRASRVNITFITQSGGAHSAYLF